MAKRKCTVSIFFTATVKSAERAAVEALTMPLGKKRKRMGFVGTPAWKKRKVDESSQSSCSLPCGQGSPELFNSNPSGQTSDSASGHHSASYRKIFGEDSDSEDDIEYEMDDTDHELDGESANEDSDATPTGFRLIDVEILTMAISHTQCEQCKDGRLSLTEDETQKAGLMTKPFTFSVINVRTVYIYPHQRSEPQGNVI